MRSNLFLLVSIFLLTHLLMLGSNGIAHAQGSATNDDMWHQNLIEDYKKWADASPGEKMQGFAFLLQPELFEEATPEVLALLDNPDFEHAVYTTLKGLIQTRTMPLGGKEDVILQTLETFEQDILSQTPEALIDHWHTIYKDKGLSSQLERIMTIFYIRSDVDAFRPLVEESQTRPEFSEAANEIISGWDELIKDIENTKTAIMDLKKREEKRKEERKGKGQPPN